jgi:hypothetical protein
VSGLGVEAGLFGVVLEIVTCDLPVTHPEPQNFSALEWISLSCLAEGFIQDSVEREKTLQSDGACE